MQLVSPYLPNQALPQATLPVFRYPKDLASPVCFSLGMLLHWTAYVSLESTVVALLFLMLGLLVFRLSPLGGEVEWRMFRRVFCVCFMTSGIAAFYVEQLQDIVQLNSDPATFYRLAKAGAVRGLPIENSVLLTDGSLMLYVWTPVYDFLQQWGFDRGRFVGTSVNTVLVASSGVLGIKMARQMYGEDHYRFHRLIQLVSVCGIFWLFASVHVRDSGILILMTALSYVCVAFVRHPDLGRRLLFLALCFYATDTILVYLRDEFRFIPFIMLVAVIVALRSATQSRRLRRLATTLSLIGLVAVVVVFAYIGQAFDQTLGNAAQSYEDAAEQAIGADQSLGLQLIVTQPRPIRMVLGSAYTYLAPIPVYLGFLFPSATHLFKSCNALFNYVLLPLMVTAVWLMFKDKKLRTPALMYIMACAIVLSVAVGLSSMEARHLGAFMMMPLLLATVPDLRVPKDRKLFRKLLRLMLYGMGMIHLLWFAIKTM